MLVNNFLYTNITEALTATATTVKLATIGDLATKLAGGNHVYVALDDGTDKREVVKVTAVAADGTATIARAQFGTTAQAFVQGVCAKPYEGVGVMCELISQGGCSTAASCDEVKAPTYSLPDAVVGKPYTGVVVFPNATSIGAVSIPAWATMTVNGNSALIQGTPTGAATAMDFVVRAQGCSNSVAILNKTLQICEQVGAA